MYICNESQTVDAVTLFAGSGYGDFVDFAAPELIKVDLPQITAQSDEVVEALFNNFRVANVGGSDRNGTIDIVAADGQCYQEE